MPCGKCNETLTVSGFQPNSFHLILKRFRTEFILFLRFENSDMAKKSKEAEKDEVIVDVEEVYSKTEDFINTNQNLIMGVVGGIIAIIVAFYAYNRVYLEPLEQEAHGQMFAAEQYFQKDSFDLALNGDGNYPGFYDVIDDFGSTKSGKRASYYVGVILMKKGQYEEAIDYLKKADFDDEMVGPLSRCLIGDCYSEMEQYEEAADFYLKCANKRDNDFTTPYGHQKAARVYEQLGDWDKSLKSLEVIQNDYKETRFAENIEMLVSRAKTAAENQ